MVYESIPCDPRNHGGLRLGPVEYIVVHYTAGDGDTAENNGRYFQNNQVGASAHWFVDDNAAVASVPEDVVAWHCGSAVYCHPRCRNGNSVAVELCSRKDGEGRYFFTGQTLENGTTLVRELMKRYEIPRERVLRHFDVTGKKCPAPLLEAGVWEAFLRMTERFDTLEQIPDWGRETVRTLIQRQILQGDGQGLDLSRDMLRLLVLLDRAGMFADRPGTV